MAHSSYSRMTWRALSAEDRIFLRVRYRDVRAMPNGSRPAWLRTAARWYCLGLQHGMMRKNSGVA